MTMNYLKNYATLGRIGYLPASGTFASLATVPLALLLRSYFSPLLYVCTILVLYLVSYLIIKKILVLFYEDDPSEIVIDELIGCLIALYAIPVSVVAWGLAFVLFRLFDIYKCGLIGRVEKLPGATGIILDDVVAGLLSNFCVHMLFVGMGVLRYAVS